jgi:hypothetical protein
VLNPSTLPDFCECRIIAENAPFRSAFSVKTLRLTPLNFASSLSPKYTAESAQFYYAFSPTTISITPRFCRKREVWLRFFAENAQNDPKTHSYEDSAKFNSAFSATRLSHASRFRRKRRVIKNYEYLCKFEEYFGWLDCVLYLLVTEICKKKFKNRLWKSRACVPLRCP